MKHCQRLNELEREKNVAASKAEGSVLFFFFFFFGQAKNKSKWLSLAL